MEKNIYNPAIFCKLLDNVSSDDVPEITIIKK